MNCARSIHSAPMTFGQIIENGDGVAFVEQKLRANAADVTGPADDENFHPPDTGSVSSSPSKLNN